MAVLMEVYTHPTFQRACRQFDLVADHLQIPVSERERLKFPKPSLTVALPIRSRVCEAIKQRGLFP